MRVGVSPSPRFGVSPSRRDHRRLALGEGITEKKDRVLDFVYQEMLISIAIAENLSE